jgi:hypothetical protein
MVTGRMIARSAVVELLKSYDIASPPVTRADRTPEDEPASPRTFDTSDLSATTLASDDCPRPRETSAVSLEGLTREEMRVERVLPTAKSEGFQTTLPAKV